MKKSHARDWLNPLGHDDTGSVASYFGFQKNPDCTWFDAELTVRDCSRQIDLDLGMCATHREPGKRRQEFLKEGKDRLKKIRIIRKHLNRVEEALEKAMGEA